MHCVYALRYSSLRLISTSCSLLPIHPLTLTYMHNSFSAPFDFHFIYYDLEALHIKNKNETSRENHYKVKQKAHQIDPPFYHLSFIAFLYNIIHLVTCKYFNSLHCFCFFSTYSLACAFFIFAGKFYKMHYFTNR